MIAGPALALMAAGAAAAPVGEAVPDPASGRVQLGVRGDLEAVPLVDADCPRDGDCDALARSSVVVTEAQVVLVRGLGVFGEAGWSGTRIREADYRGDGWQGAAGLRAAVPLFRSGWWLAANGRFAFGTGYGAALDLGGRESTRFRLGTVSALAAWTEPGGGVSFWLGGQGAWWWDWRVFPLGFDGDEPVLRVDLEPKRPVAAIAGASLTSEPLGAGVRRDLRLASGVEARAGQVWGASAWLGVRY